MCAIPLHKTCMVTGAAADDDFVQTESYLLGKYFTGSKREQNNKTQACSSQWTWDNPPTTPKSVKIISAHGTSAVIISREPESLCERSDQEGC